MSADIFDRLDMCGIWALFGCYKEVNTQFESCLKIHHRGPDAFRMENVRHYPNCWFGFHRLSIMDEAAGMQPMKVRQFPHLTLCYNGEIYNYKQVGDQFNFNYQTECDGEAILHLYNKGGAEFAAQHLDGVFAFCLLDTRAKRVYIGRDTFGVKPCFTLHLEDGFLGVCSEAKGLVGLSLTGHHLEGKTQHFPPGHVEVYGLAEDGKVSLLERKRFHTIGEEPIYTAAVRISGGVDSSLIAALVVQLVREEGIEYQVQTFSVGMEGSPDLIAARKVAEHIGSEHHEVKFTAEQSVEVLNDVIYHSEMYDILNLRCAVGMYLLCKYISEKTDSVVIFSGEGSDEIAQGYTYFHKAPSAEEADKQQRRLCEDLHMFDVCRAERCTAAWGLELRAPFLDHLFTSYYLTLPSEERRPKNAIEKYTLRKAFDGLGLIPNEVLWRPKEGFSDGVASPTKPLYIILQESINKQVSDKEFQEAASLYTFNPPRSKEAYHYRKVFESHFKGHGHWIPYYWFPMWLNTKQLSARTLSYYN